MEGTSPSHFPFSLEGMSRSWRQQLAPGVAQGRASGQGQVGWDPEQPGLGKVALLVVEGGFGTGSPVRILSNSTRSRILWLCEPTWGAQSWLG